MSLDWELMIFAAGAQLIMAVMGTWWALRPPNPKWHRAIIAAYAVVGLCGIAAIGYSTYRANISEERKEPHPRLVISKFQVVPIPTPDKTGDVGIRLYMVNRGDRFGYSPKITSGIKIGAPLTTAQVEHEMAKLIKIAEKSAPSRVDEIEVGEETFRPMQRIRNVDWQAVVSGKKLCTYLLFLHLRTTRCQQMNFG